MAGATEPDDQLTAERCRSPAAVPADRSRARGPLILCAVLVVAASAAAAWWLGVVAAFAVYATGTLALVAALLGLGRRSGGR